MNDGGMDQLRTEARYRTLVEHAPVGILEAGADGSCRFVNPRWCALAGLPQEEAVGYGWVQAIHPDDKQRVMSAWLACVRGGAPAAMEHRMLRPDGSVAWVQTTVVMLPDPAGATAGYIGIFGDITPRKTADFALRESEKRFRLVASRAPVGIFMTNPLGQTEYVNPSWCNLAGMPPEQAHGYGWTAALYPDDRARVFSEWQEAVREGVSCKSEYRFLRPDGTVTWVHGVAVQLRDGYGRLTGYIGTVADFTERKHAEMALRESEERFRLLADNIVQFAWIGDTQGQVQWVNRRWMEYIGISPEEVTWARLGEFHHPEHRQRVEAKFQRHLATGADWEDCFPLRNRDGLYRWFLARAIPVRDEAGRITRWFGTKTDITDLRDAQEMLRRTQEDLLAQTGDLERKVANRTASLQEAIAQMEEFSYSVSHDLRAPLRAMNGYAEALMEEYGAVLDETAHEYIRRIQRASERMEKLTHDVLTYSRLGQTEIILSTVDLAAVVRDLVGTYAELQPAAVELVVKQPLHRVRGHELSISQCLGNLLSNAAKFVAPGVRPRIKVFTAANDGRVRVWVADNGIGIRPDLQCKLFQVFERLPTPTPYAGTGIGLAIVRKAMEKMGGRYGVESDGVNGSQFWIELPGA